MSGKAKTNSITEGKIIIAIDGYASTGKSTFAKAVATYLGYRYIDSGAMYRAITLYALRKGLTAINASTNVEGLVSCFKDIDIDFKIEGDINRCILCGEEVENEIRSLEVSNCVSPISAIPQVREFVDSFLRRWGEAKGIVMDGRDIGTAVFPNAELKIFMTAKPEIRAQRRLLEMNAKGLAGDFDSILENVLSRDAQDSNREAHPLKQADDAILLDNSYMTPQMQMDWFIELIGQKWPWMLK